jgi:threonine/homoserine/homoserine lactone efflux protein
MSEYVFIFPIAVFLTLGVISPGPSFILVAQTAMAKSRAAALATALGMGVGAMMFALIASLGLFVLLDTVPLFYLALKIVGGSYLCFLAIKMWRSSTQKILLTSIVNQGQSGVFKNFCRRAGYTVE